MKNLTLVIMAIFIYGCSNTSSDKTKNWELISTGKSKAEVISLMGDPNTTNSISILGLNMERLTWKNHISGEIYQVDMATNRVVSKHYNN